MHAGVHEWVAAHSLGEGPREVVEFGSREINGTVRALFPEDHYTGVDVLDGPGVDVVADAVIYRHHVPADVVLCLETFEHTEKWPAICLNAALTLRDGGVFVVTAAGPGWPPHSAYDGDVLQPGEWYQTIDPADLRAVLDPLFSDVRVEQVAEAVYAKAVR